MQVLRKYAIKVLPRPIPSLVPLTATRFNTSFTSKERAEEATFFANEDARKLEQLKASLDNILSNPNHEKRDEVLKILESKATAAPTFAEKYGLHDYRVAGPIALMLLGPMISNEWILLNYQVPFVASFLLFAGTAYLQGRDAIGKAIDSGIDEIADKLKSYDESKPAGLKELVNSYNNILSIKEDLQVKNKLVDDLQAAQAQNLTLSLEHAYRDSIAKKLDSLYALEDAASHAIRNRMLTAVKSDVKKTFTTNKTAKEQALAQAIAVLTSGGKSPIGKDVVGEAFGASIKTYREDYLKKPDGSDEILVQLEKDIASVITPPVLEEKGSNVYESHPI